MTDSFVSLGYARVDTSRLVRCGRPEAVFCSGKLPEQAAEIARNLFLKNGYVLCTRADEKHAKAVREILPEAVHHSQARLIAVGSAPKMNASWRIAVVTAGTTDLPVAEEAAVTLETYGWTTERIFDAGVAGLHRLLDRLETLRQCHVLIVVAGMDGALPSVVGGLVRIPVIAVPTSTGYGANLGGIAPLLTMLNSCSAGVTTVNIDNGFGAASAADAILRMAAENRQDAAANPDQTSTP